MRNKRWSAEVILSRLAKKKGPVAGPLFQES